MSFIAYENERDHIGWHQHHEDRCRDATVYIVSMGEVRTFDIRRVCESHRLCDKCNSSCHADSKTLCKKCRANVKARKTCKTCESTPKQSTSLQPEHGSIIVLPDDYDLTHEHAVLGKQDVGGDKDRKGLRISINTKNIREEDIAYVERENGTDIIPSGALRKAIPGMLSLSADTIHKGIAPGVPQQTAVVHCKRDEFDVYIGKVNGAKRTKGYLPESKFANRSGGDYESYFRKKLRDEPGFAAEVMKLHSKRLGCWCKGTSRDFSKCHGHIIAGWLDRIFEKWEELKPNKKQ